MIQIEIDWSDYTDYKVDEYKRDTKYKCYSPTEEEIETERQANQPPTYSISYGINPNYVVSYWVQRETESGYWYEKCTVGVASGSCVVYIIFTNGRKMRLYCYEDAADKIIRMLQGEKSNEVVKVSGVKEIEIRTETKVTSMPD